MFTHRKIAFGLMIGLALLASAAHAQEKAPAQAAPRPLTNNTIVEMTKDGATAAEIIAKIKASPCDFDLSLGGIEELRAAKVPEEVINAMVQAPPMKPLRPGQDGVSVPECDRCPAPSYSAEARKKKVQGSVLLKLVVTSDGRPINVMGVSGPTYGLEESAIEAVRTWKFKPAKDASGGPVSTMIQVEVNFNLRAVQTQIFAAGEFSSSAEPAKAGQNGVGFPRCVECPVPSFTEEARREKIQGLVVLEVVITPEGRATNIILKKSAGYGLDGQAIEAVKAWKLKPATDSSGSPVPVKVVLEVSFRLK